LTPLFYFNKDSGALIHKVRQVLLSALALHFRCSEIVIMILADPFLYFVFSWKLSLIETLDYELYADQVELHKIHLLEVLLIVCNHERLSNRQC
jgi:hypothetical protein